MKKPRQRIMQCILCNENMNHITFRDTELLRSLMSGQNKILPRKKTGTCAKHQRLISREIKRARDLGLLANRGQ
jgi:small subunit ribosomal protein S18